MRAGTGIEVYGDYFDTGETAVVIDSQGVGISYLGSTQVNA